MTSRSSVYSLKRIIGNGIRTMVDERRSPDYSRRFRRYMKNEMRRGHIVDYMHLSHAAWELGIPVGHNPILVAIYDGFADAQAKVNDSLRRRTNDMGNFTPEQLQRMQEMRDLYSGRSYNGGYDDERVFVVGDVVHVQPDMDVRARANDIMEMEDIGIRRNYSKVVPELADELASDFSPQVVVKLLCLKSMHNNGYIFG